MQSRVILIFIFGLMTSNVWASEYSWVISKNSIEKKVNNCLSLDSGKFVGLNFCLSELETKKKWNTLRSQCELLSADDILITKLDSTECTSCGDVRVQKSEVSQLVEITSKIVDKSKIQIAPKTSREKIDFYAKQDKDYKIKKIIYEGSKVTPTSIEYNFGRERLSPGECLYLSIPEHLRDKPLLFVNLGHTQSSSDNTGYDYEKEWDKNPGLTTVQVNESNNDGQSRWRYWNGPSSGDFGAKFAEPSHMELEGLYEWYKYGHKDIRTHTLKKDALYVDAARLCSIGKDPVTQGSIIIKTAAKPSDSYTEFNISKSNRMGDPLTAAGRDYGSRSDALFLGNYKNKKISDELQLINGRIELQVEEGKLLNSFELAVGDRRKDGSSGGAKVSAYLLKSNGEKFQVLQRENVPPEGVLIGTPAKEKIKITNGDKLIIETNWDEAFVMGMRVGYLEEKVTRLKTAAEIIEDAKKASRAYRIKNGLPVKEIKSAEQLVKESIDASRDYQEKESDDNSKKTALEIMEEARKASKEYRKKNK